MKQRDEMGKGFVMPSIKLEGHMMLDMCSIQCEGVYLLKEIDRLKGALKKIATGEGAYGQQAHEYKQIAREALNDGKTSK